MHYKEQLKQYVHNKNWDASIKLIQAIIDEDSNNADNYISICYLLMDILVNEMYDSKKHNYYAGLLKKYFLESYSKYSYNPEYLFYIGFIASMSEWYFDIEIEEVETMLNEATCLEPENLLYKWGYCCITDQRAAINTKMKYSLSKQILESNILMENIAQKGLLGEYLKGFILSIYESTKVLL